jgi:hypothetical protein
MLCNGVVLYHCRFSCLYLRLIAYSWRASALRAQLGFAELKSQFAPLPTVILNTWSEYCFLIAYVAF